MIIFLAGTIKVFDCGLSLPVLKLRVGGLVLGKVDGHEGNGGDSPENHIHAHFVAASQLNSKYPNCRMLNIVITGNSSI